MIGKLLIRLFPLRPDDPESGRWRAVYGLLLAVMLPAIPLLSLDAGISADEGRYRAQAKKVYDYYASGGEDKAAITQKGVDPQHYNSQSFDLAMVVIEKVFQPEDPYRIRHIVNALSGWLVLFVISLYVARVIGYRAAALTLLLLFISPRFLGHSYNNNKDIPITAAFALSSYFMMVFFRDYPEKRLRHACWIALAIASGISLRIGAIVLVAYFFLFAGVFFLATTSRKEWLHLGSLRRGGVLLAFGCSILLGSYFIGILPWPFGLEGPFSNTLEVLKAMSSLGVSIMQVFEGHHIWSNEIPWYYGIKYMAITIPFVVFAGVALAAAFSWRTVNRTNGLPLFILLFSWLFPIIYSAISIKNDYGGWRHLMFTYPYMVALAAIGFDAVLKRLPRVGYRYVAGGVIALLCFHPVSHIIRNHPHEYVYFNELFGGVDRARGYYETDYYQHSIRAACEWLEDHLAEDLEAGQTFTIGKNDGQVRHYFRDLEDQLQVVHTYGYYARSRHDWDYGIFYTGYISPHQLREGLWPPDGTLHTVNVDNTPVCAVVKRPSREDYLGYEALKDGKRDSAIEHFNAYLEVDPRHEGVHGALASLYLEKGDPDQALFHARTALGYHPEALGALHVSGRVYLQLEQYESAIEVFSRLAQRAPNQHLAHYFLALAQFHKGNHDAAIAAARTAIQVHPGFAPAYRLLAGIYQETGNLHAARIFAGQAQALEAAAQR